MKRVKIMLSAIFVMAIVAGALAFKVKKTNGYCVYKISTFWNEEEEMLTLTCPKLGDYTAGAYPNVTTLLLVHTINLPCENTALPAFTHTSRCNKTIIDVTRE